MQGLTPAKLSIPSVEKRLWIKVVHDISKESYKGTFLKSFDRLAPAKAESVGWEGRQQGKIGEAAADLAHAYRVCSGSHVFATGDRGVHVPCTVGRFVGFG